ncbi:MAG: fibronectin type III domain-containing protein [Bacteroidales bacterium]
MKKNFTLMIALFSLITSTFGQVLLDETFDYTVPNLASAPGWTTAGTLTTGTGRNILDPTVTSALTYSNSGGLYFLSGMGKTLNSDISSSNDYKAYKSFTSTPVTTGSVYLTFMYKAGVPQGQTRSEVFGMAINTNAGAKVWVGKGTTGTFKFGTTRGSSTSGDVKWGATLFTNVNEVILVVLKYDFATQTSSVYLNPTISSISEPTAEVIDNTSSTIRTSLNNIWFRADGSSIAKYNIGGARVSTTWAAAVAVQVPQLSPPAVGTASSISNTGFTANWTSVANATGYSVKVYSGATLVGTTNASGQATENVAISGLASGTDYTYKVTAIGDGINYSSSDPSAASPIFTTLGLVQPTVGVATNITANGFTANWTAVANATGYDVKVYLGTLFVSTTNAPGQATSNLAITGLSFGTSYTFVVIAKGDGVTYLDSSPSSASPTFITSYSIVSTIHTDFGDGTWGTPAGATPGNGLFPSSSINGFVMEKAVLRAITKKDRRGFTHINDIALDNLTNAGLVVFPEVNSVEQIELHAYTGTAERTFALEEYNAGTSVWIPIGTYTYNTASKASGYDSIYVIPISRSVPTKFRVRNTGGGGMNIAQVISRLTNPVTLPVPVIGAATNITSFGFTANWTPVLNATGYEVFVYKRDNFVSQTSVSGQSSSSKVISGLISDSTYTFKVRTTGDGYVNYADSYLSSASIPVTILSPPASATWTGAESNEWSMPGNWNPSTPGAFTDVTIPAGLVRYPTLSAAGTCHNILFGSTAAGTATLLDNGFLTVTGTATVQRYFTGDPPPSTDDWHLVSSPVAVATAGIFSGMYMQNYSETSSLFSDITSDATLLNVMEGYALYSTLSTTNTVSFTGDLNLGTKTRSFTFGSDGYNLMGNPFVSSLDWENVIIPAGLDNVVYVLDAASSNYLPYIKGVPGQSNSQFVPPMQGFFVKATAPGIFELGNVQRTHSGATNFYKSENPKLVTLEATGSKYYDQTQVYFNEQAGIEHDGQFDAYKIISTKNSKLPQIYSITPMGEKLAINGLPATSDVPVGFTAVEAGSFNIKAAKTGEFSKVILEDTKTGILTDLLKSSYSFNFIPGETAQRFVLHFGPLSTNDIESSTAVIYSYGKTVYVNFKDQVEGDIFVYNVLGQLISTRTSVKDMTEIGLDHAGNYIVKVISKDNTMVRKVFIN